MSDWYVDCGDPDVGIFGDTFVHETCPNEFDAGTTYDEHMHGAVDHTGHVSNTITVTCHDCGATTSFEDAVYVGREDEEALMREDERDWLDEISSY